MIVHPLHKASGTWLNDKQMVKFSWEPGNHNDRYISVCGVVETKEGLRLDTKCYADKDIATDAGSDMFSIMVRVTLTGGGGVSRRQFFLCSSDTQALDINAIEELINTKQGEPYLCSVITGFAQLHVWTKKRRAGTVTAVSFKIRSSVNIAKGILGYKYVCGNKEICLAFPDAVTGGKQKTQFGSLLIPTGNEINVVVMDPQFARNVEIRKGSFLGGLL